MQEMGDDMQEIVRSVCNLSEADKHQEEKDLKELQEQVKKMISKKKDTAKSLREAADKLDQV